MKENYKKQGIDFGDENDDNKFKIDWQKGDVYPYHIFRLAKAVLIFNAIIFIIFGIIRIFYSEYFANDEGVKLVWDWIISYLNISVSFIFGMYFAKKT